MMNRNKRDAERRNYIKEKIMENLECVKDDPQSLFVLEVEQTNIMEKK